MDRMSTPATPATPATPDSTNATESSLAVGREPETVCVTHVVLDGVTYDVQKLSQAYADVTQRIQSTICKIFAIMVICSSQKTVLPCKPFEFFGWLPRAKHVKLTRYEDLVNNLSSVAKTFDLPVSPVLQTVRTSLAYSLHAPYFEGLAEGFEEDLLDVQVACAGMYSLMDIETLLTDQESVFAAILSNNVAWFLKTTKPQHSQYPKTKVSYA